MTKLLRIVLAALIGTAVATGASALTVLNVGMGGEPDSLDPQKAELVYARTVFNQIWLPLVSYNDEGNLVGAAAKSWDVSSDGLTYTFHLRGDLKWTDGSQVTASDFVFAYRRRQDPKTIAIGPEIYDWIKNAKAVNEGKLPPSDLGVAAPDPLTLVITLQNPDPLFLTDAALEYALPQKVIEKYGRDWTQIDHFVSDGAYKLKERVPGTRITLVKNPLSIYAPTTQIDEINIYAITDDNALTQRYRTGELDMVYSVTPEEFDKMLKLRPAEAVAYPASRTDYITLNTKRAELSDPRVRQALSMLIERDIIAAKVVGGKSTPAYHLVRPDWPGIDAVPAPDFAAWPRDERIAQAKRLLAAAGYGPGHPLSLELVFSGQGRERQAIVIKAMWDAAGIRTSLLAKEPAGLFAAFDSGDFDAAIAGFDMGVELDPYDVVSGVEPGAWNDRSGYRSAAFETAIDGVRQAGDPQVRASRLAAAELVWSQGYATLPVFHEDALWFISPVVKGWSMKAQPYFWRDLKVDRATPVAGQ